MVAVGAYRNGEQIAISYFWTGYWVTSHKAGDGDVVGRAGDREAAAVLSRSLTSPPAKSAARDQVFATRPTQTAGHHRDTWAVPPRPVAADASLAAARHATPSTEALDAAFQEFALDSTRAW
jgi:hypothetical protein